jgi:hypothetical protein
MTVMGVKTLDPATVRSAVEKASAGDRAPLLRRLTKEMVVDESRKIELDDLITGEVSRVLKAMRDTERFPQQFTGPENERAVHVAEAATEYWRLVAPFCWSLQVAARWAAPENLGPWVRGLHALSAEAMKPASGVTALLDLREIPILASVIVAALASTGQSRWETFKALLVENMVTDPTFEGKRVAIIESVSFWDPFGNAEVVAHVIARAITTDDDFATAVTGYNTKYGRFHTPVAEWLFALLRPVFDEQFPDDDAYATAFDYAEVALGIVNEDLGHMRDTGGTGRPLRFRNRWFGRSTWRYAHRHCEPIADIADEQTRNGSAWNPLEAGLFGGASDRAAAAIKQYGETFREIARRQW